ncbi:Hypothetical predicted protein, partial [Marmota monax]
GFQVPKQTTSISTCARLLAAHLCRNSIHQSHTGHPAATHAQELQLPLPCGPPSTTMGLPWSLPSWDSAATAVVPNIRYPDCTWGHCTGSRDSRQPQHCMLQSCIS